MPIKSKKIGDWIADFRDSDAPQFKGKSKKGRRNMAIAAYYEKYPKKIKEASWECYECGSTEGYEKDENDPTKGFCYNCGRHIDVDGIEEETTSGDIAKADAPIGKPFKRKSLKEMFELIIEADKNTHEIIRVKPNGEKDTFAGGSKEYIENLYKELLKHPLSTKHGHKFFIRVKEIFEEVGQEFVAYKSPNGNVWFVGIPGKSSTGQRFDNEEDAKAFAVEYNKGRRLSKKEPKEPTLPNENQDWRDDMKAKIGRGEVRRGVRGY